MFSTAVLLTWVLMGTVTTYRCHGEDCRLVRQLPARQLTTFATPEACDVYRRALAQQHLPEVRSATRPEVRVTKQITYTCTPGGPL
jgi:hypothetical protein